MFEEKQEFPVCLTPADKFGDHHVGCGGNADRIFRHYSLRVAVFSAAQSVALAHRREVPSLIPGSQHRPADVCLPCWKGGRPVALDITVISTMQQSTNAVCCQQSRSCLVRRKFATHAPACQTAGISFIPLAIESLGGLSDATNKTISSIGRLIGQRFEVPPHESSCQKPAISLWRGNATAWIHRCRPPAPFIDGVV